MVDSLVVKIGLEKPRVVGASIAVSRVLNWYSHGNCMIGDVNVGVETLMVDEVLRVAYEMVNRGANDTGA